ncbi:PREDICTED: LOC18777017 isoform, partial [Prunus dulcis]
QILTAIGVDGNNGMFPLAYAVVEIESKSSWIWFLELLIADLGIQNGLAWVFISDKQKGLIPAMQTVLPNIEHRMCVRHLYNNFNGQHTGLALKHLLWVAARATTLPWWEAEMDNLKKEDADAWGWLIERPVKNWSRSHFATHYKCDLLLNNLCESFNAAIIDARDKPILTCLERIRMYIMISMANRRASCQHW